MNTRITKFPLLDPRVSCSPRILSWNVYHGDRKHSEKVFRTLARLDCDILLLSELRGDHGLPQKIHELGYGGVFVEMNYRNWLRPIQGGVAIFSRIPLVEEASVVETMTRGFFRISRYYVETCVQVSDKVLTIGMTHNALRYEWGYAAACRALYDCVSDQTENFLLVGDLNATPRFEIVHKLRKRLVRLGPPVRIPSYPASRWVRWLTPQMRIDYAFATRDIRRLVEKAWFDTEHPSDHHPLLIQLRAGSDER